MAEVSSVALISAGSDTPFDSVKPQRYVLTTLRSMDNEPIPSLAYLSDRPRAFCVDALPWIQERQAWFGG